MGRVKITLRPDWNKHFNWADDADGADAKLPTMRGLLPPSPPAEKTTARQQQARQNETPFRPKKADSVVVNQNL
jgi:hypothetical protein